MPVIPLDGLLGAVPSDSALRELAHALARETPGLVITTGQAQSGKATMGASLAGMLARGSGRVVALAATPHDIEVFRPLPQGWREVIVGTEAGAWDAAFEAIDDGEVAFVPTVLDRNVAPALWRSRPGRWMVVTIDSPLLGADIAYPLMEMGLPPEDFVARTRCVWSQFLVRLLCKSCARPARLGEAELEHLLPTGRMPRQLLTSPGCPECGGQGIKDRLAATEVLLVNDRTRAQVLEAFEEGQALPPDPAWHITVHEQAWRLLDDGAISVETYRDTVRRNPLLRAQNRLEQEQAHSHKLGTVFEKFVSPEVKRRLMESRTLDAIAGGESREVTCLFCDIRGFTARAEFRDPAELFAELNLYFSEVVDCVLAFEGTIDKFIGDAVMVVWGAPTDQPDHAHRAIACALALRERIAAFNARRGGEHPILIGIGINSGRAAAGCVGTDQRMEYTVLGDAVNVAARLESRARPGQILVSAASKAQAGPAFAYGPELDFELKGKTEAVRACEVLARA
ncbi:adenylate/guanylate cyclase domain-containing protein [Ramlibacter sp. PS4R-6]|uniref:adenylate/guanylate cyclase domain-containing protein n=1 Tax=Ramlibacter sp. PS4R-6 TaxID=3133438 RepID=UPI0030A6DC2A